MLAERAIPAEGREAVAEELRRFIVNCKPGKPLVVTVKEQRNSRSNQQNNALWGVAYPPLVQATGNDAAILHEYFCGEFFGWVEREVFGRRKLTPRRTTTTDENGKRDVMAMPDFADFYDFVQRRGAENGVWIPDPDPAWRWLKEEEGK